MGHMIKNHLPQIKNTTRVRFNGIVIKQGENVFRESVSFVDNSFYKMFDFPVKWGNKKHFTDPDGIVLTDILSEKLFDKINPVGKTLSVRFNNNGKEEVVNFTIKGVFAKQPDESSWYFSSVAPYSRMTSLGMDKPGDWSHIVDMTFLEADNEKALLPVINS